MPSTVTFKGSRATGDFVTYERPENWRQGILALNPNGSSTITGLTSTIRSEPTDDPVFD